MLAAILIMTSFAVPASAEGPITFELVLPENYNHGTSEAITAEIRVNNNTEGMSSATFYIDLPEFLTTQTENPDECVFSTSLTVGYLTSAGWASDGEHRLSVGLLGLRVYKGDGAIVTVNLKPTPDATKEDLENMSVTLGIREAKTSDGVTHKGEDEDVQISDSPIETPEITCSHPETITVEGKEPTCTEDGYGEGEICKFCGEPMGDIEIYSALGHDFKYDSTLIEATCTSVGKDLYKCTRCETTEEREVPMKDHVKSEGYKYDGTSHWFYCVNCDTVIGEKEAHTPDTEWHSDDASVDGHYHVCSVCKAAVGVEEHEDSDSDGECDICGAALHEHIADTSKWLYDDDCHYHACTVSGCKAKLDKTSHDTETTETEKATCTKKGKKTTTCKVCDYEKTEETDMLPHTPDTDWHTEDGAKEHWHICTVCGNKIEETVTEHTYGEYVKDSKNHTRTCADCGASEVEEHKESAEYKTDDESHWHYCEVCGYEFEKTAHASDKGFECDSSGHWKICDDCNAKFDFDAHTNAQLIPEKKATSAENGNVAYWYCPDCGKYFYDNNGKIGAGPYDSAEEFITKYNVGCNGIHQLFCVPMNETYHMVICGRRCGFVMTMPHNFGANGVCLDCGYVRIIQAPVGDTFTEDDNVIEVDVATEGYTVDEITVNLE